MHISTQISFLSVLILVLISSSKVECHSLKSRFLRFTGTAKRNITRSSSTATSTSTFSTTSLSTSISATNAVSSTTSKPSNSTQKANLPAGLTRIGSVGHKAFYTDPDKLGLAWAEALDFCHELGLQPASLESLSEHKITRNYLAKLPHRFFWLAATDYFHEGHWQWLRTGESFKFQKWNQGYPTKSRKNNCLYLSYGNDGWIDASCSSNKLIIRPLCQLVYP